MSVETAWLDRWLATNPLPLSKEHPCAYLQDRLARSRAFSVKELPPGVYRHLLDRNFRRSGHVIYQPACDGCTECRQIRIPVAQFRLSRSLTRVWKANRDVEVEVASPVPTREKWRVFRDYLTGRHDGTMSGTWEEYVEFLYQSPVDTLEITYRIGGRIMAVSLADRFDDALSSVYVYFDNRDARRSPGTYSALWEIDYARRISLDYYYLGYYVAGADSMSYKSRFRPHELLASDGRWESISSNSARLAGLDAGPARREAVSPYAENSE
ncbi:MAG: arginyltransferase [Planctomycetes bacterium]|nr:arginyltransferase [Planctomycetota bacterium]